MARTLTLDLDAVQEDAYKVPDFKVFVYDIVSTRSDPAPETINRIVQGDINIADPLDLTEHVGAIAMVERESDFVQGSIQGNSITFTVVDRNITFDPVGGSQGNWLRQGNVIRIYEGEGRATRIANENFNGTTVGVAGTYSLSGRDVTDSGTLEVREGSVGGTLLVEGVDYTVDEFNGTITGLGAKWVAATDYYVTYTARQIPVQDWPITFTGTIVGRAGADERDRGGNQLLQLAATDRAATLLQTATTSQPFAQGTLYQDMMASILEDELGFAASEYDFGSVGLSEITSQATTQFVDESPMVSIAKIAFVFGFVPRFRGDGVMVLAPNTATKGTSVFYADRSLFTGFARPFSPLDDVNEVEVLGLSATLEKVEQPVQVLARASTTLGFFGGDERIELDFSDDQTQQADSPRLNVVQSVTGALIPFGAESFTPNVDDDGGSRSGVIDVEGAFYAPLVTSLYAARIAAAAIPDSWAGIGGGNTIPVGRLIEGSAAISIATIQATIGRGQYEIVGTPFEYVFREIRRIARVKDVSIADRRSLTIENHLLDDDSGDEVQEVANRELRNVRKRGNKWTCQMKHDLRLEPFDKFTFEDDDQEFVIKQITRRLAREAETQVASLELYETTNGVWP